MSDGQRRRGLACIHRNRIGTCCIVFRPRGGRHRVCFRATGFACAPSSSPACQLLDLDTCLHCRQSAWLPALHSVDKRRLRLCAPRPARTALFDASMPSTPPRFAVQSTDSPSRAFCYKRKSCRTSPRPPSARTLHAEARQQVFRCFGQTWSSLARSLAPSGAIRRRGGSSRRVLSRIVVAGGKDDDAEPGEKERGERRWWPMRGGERTAEPEGGVGLGSRFCRYHGLGRRPFTRAVALTSSCSTCGVRSRRRSRPDVRLTSRKVWAPCLAELSELVAAPAGAVFAGPSGLGVGVIRRRRRLSPSSSSLHLTLRSNVYHVRARAPARQL